MEHLKTAHIVLMVLLVEKYVYSQTCSNLDANVIIIGAGMSGISAANRLHENGMSKILILEALSRSGGRVVSAEIGGVNVSIGATWIQGIDPTNPTLHPLYELAERCGGLEGFYQDYDSETDYDSQGTDITDSERLRWDDYDEAYEGAQELALRLQRDQRCVNASVRYGLTVGGWTPVTPEDNWIDWFNHDYCFGEPPEISSLCESIASSNRTSSNFASTSASEGGDYFVTDQEGFEKLITCLATDVLEESDNQLRLGVTINEIDWSNEDCVCVRTNENEPDNQYCARYAISTLSVGVLQNGTVRFVPELPDSKVRTIGKFKMVDYIHIIIEFSEVFWDPTELIGHIHPDRGYYALFINLNMNYPSNPKLLAAVLSGSNAERVVRQPLADTTSEIIQVLQSIYPDRNVSTPINMIIPDWTTNPLFWGAYSDAPVGIIQEDYEKLAAPIRNLYFSGEATSSEYSGFVHGAYFAGIDTAEKIIQRASSASNAQLSAQIMFFVVLCVVLSLL